MPLSSDCKELVGSLEDMSTRTELVFWDVYSTTRQRNVVVGLKAGRDDIKV